MTRRYRIRIALAAIIAVAVIIPVAVYGQDEGDSAPAAQVDALLALDKSFTFQGRLTDAGVPANGSYDFNFYLYEAPVGGNQVGPVQTIADVAVTAGLFTVKLNFGDVFHGEEYSLEIQVRPGASAGAYTTLSPREQVGAVPNALFASQAGSLLLPQSIAADVNAPLLSLTNTSPAVSGIGLSVETDKASAIVGGSVEGAGGVFGSTNGTALAVSGPIKVIGTRPAAFIHTTSGSGSHITVIDHPSTNDNPTAILFVTQHWETVYNPHEVGVYYFNGRWRIFNEDFVDLPVGAMFNVLVINQ